jgi:hypothetical protein
MEGMIRVRGQHWQVDSAQRLYADIMGNDKQENARNFIQPGVGLEKLIQVTL